MIMIIVDEGGGRRTEPTARFVVLIAVAIRITLFWDATPSTLIHIFQNIVACMAVATQ
jgi:hypothetical protein